MDFKRVGDADGFVLPVRADEVARYFIGNEHKECVYVIALLEFSVDSGKDRLPCAMEINRKYVLYKPISLADYNELKIYSPVAFKVDRTLPTR